MERKIGINFRLVLAFEVLGLMKILVSMYSCYQICFVRVKQLVETTDQVEINQVSEKQRLRYDEIQNSGPVLLPIEIPTDFQKDLKSDISRFFYQKMNIFVKNPPSVI